MNAATLVRRFAKAHPLEAARILEGLDGKGASGYFAEEEPQTCADLIAVMDPTSALGSLEPLDPDQSAAILGRLDLEAGATLLRMMESGDRNAILERLPEERREPLATVLTYPEHTAGGLMDPRSLALPRDLSLDEGLLRVQRYPERASYYLYVIERSRVLAGVISIREMMIGDRDNSLAEVMRPNPVRLNDGDHLTAVVAHPGWLEFQVLPVVDSEGRFVGALRHRTLRRLHKDPSTHGSTHSVSSALGELFQVGLTGLAQIGGATTHAPGKGRQE